MSKFKTKLAGRIMALVLSGAMVMSNMSAYAAELAPKKSVETEQTDKTETLGAEFSEDEETPEKQENPVDNRDNEDESQPGGGGGDNESQPGGGDDESRPGGGDDESRPGGGDDESRPGGGDDESQPGNDEGSSVADEGSSVATEASDVEGSDDDESGSEPASEPANEPDDIVKTGTHILDMDVEFAGTANSTKFSVAAGSTDPTVTGLGTNDKETKTYTSADGYFKLHYKADGTRIDSGAKTFEGKTKTLNVNMQGTILDDNASIEFTVTEVPAKLKAYWRGGGGGTRDIYVLDNEKAEVPGLYDSMTGSETQVTEFTIEEKGTYYLGCKSGGSRFFYVSVSQPAKFDMDVEFDGTANSTKFSVAAGSTDPTVTGLGTNDKETKTYTSADGYFKLHYKADGTRVDSGAKTFEGKTKTLNVNMQGTILDDNASIEFTVTEAPAKLKAYWRGGGGGTRDIYVLDNEKAEVPGLYDSMTGSETQVTEFIIEEKGTYYLGCKTGGSRFFYVEVEEAYVPSGGPDRGDWEKVAAPEITKIEYTRGDPSIKVTVKGVVNSMGEGADKVALRVYDPELDGAVITTTTGSTTTTEADKNHETVLTYAPTKSMQLKFGAVLSREPDKDEDGNIIKSYEDKVGDIYSEDGEEKIIDFIYPLGTPDLPMAKNAGKGEDGKGKVEISWSAVSEAEKYNLYISSTEGSVDGVEPIEVSGLSYTAEGLELESTVYISLEAVRGEDISSRSLEKSVTVTGKEMITYIFDAADYSSEVDTNTNEATNENNPKAGNKYGTLDFLKLSSATNGSNVNTYFRKSNSTGVYLELARTEYGKLQFTVYGDEADISFTLASTGDSNHSTVALRDENNNNVAGSIIGSGSGALSSNAYDVYGSSTSTLSYSLTKGTYVFLVPSDGENRGVRIHKIVLNDSSEMPDPGAWSEVDKPIIKKVSYTRGEGDIIVEAEGYVGYDGADTLKLEMLDASGAVVATQMGADESKVSETTITNETQTFKFTPTASGAYSFRASLVRSGEPDIVMEDALSKWTISEFTLPLATPSIVSLTNLKSENAAVEESAASGNSESSESGSAGEQAQAKEGALEIVFNGVDEADYYVVAAFEDNTFNADDKYIDISAAESAEKSVRIDASEELLTKIDGLSRGNHYLTVQAFRDEAKNPLNLKEETITLLRKPESSEGEGSSDIEKPSDVAELNDVAELSDVEGSSDIEESSDTEGSGDASGSDDTKPANAKEVVRSQAAAGMEKFVNGKNDTRWAHTVYGSNTSRATYKRGEDLDSIDHQGTDDTPSNGSKEIVNKETGDLDSVIVWSENGRGKVVPATTDGFSYYYTSVDPNNNFSLSAIVDVLSWKYSNGQDGFGMMVSDTVGKDGDDGDTWTNCYQLLASKIEYSYKLPTYDNEGNIVEEEPYGVTNESGNGSTIMRYSMRLGLGWTAKTGATAADVAKIKAGAMTTPVNFSSESGTLETSAGETKRNGEHLYSGEYNAVGNAANATPAMSTSTKGELLTRFRLQIEKYNNAYVLRYLKVNAATAEEIAANEKEFVTIGGKQYEVLASKAFSDDLNNTLTKIDKNNIYIGFFAARNARIKMSEINLETEKDKSDYQVPTEMINPSANFTSEEASNSKNYDLVFSGNFDGTLTILKNSDYEGDPDKLNVDDVKEVVVSGQKITAGTRHTFTVPLEPGDNYFVFHAKPDEEFVPGENQMLTSTAMQISKEPFRVTYHEAFEGDTIYVEPNGARIGTKTTIEDTEYLAGTKENPTNIYDAVSYAIAGQTIKLAPGHYDLMQDDYAQTISGIKYSKNLLIGRNHDGTSRKYITIEPEDPSAERPVLDFGRNTIDRSPAFTLAGNYWHLKNFDVTGSRDGQDGIKVSGSHNILEGMHTYLNGNTGVQISRYLGSDSRSDWPSYNTMLNCSSYMNYDAGYEDADGFAAKLTCGEGNKFIGCIAAYNADDGWDMFAKRETGSIGSVTLENCLAFKNGYLFGSRYSNTDYIQRDLTKINKNTSVVSAGNGNGFKMGGDSLSGYHVLRNSVAFGNKSKGIDSNSCPDIQIYNSISFNNEANNVAMYTGTGGLNTDYDAENIISIKDSNCLSGGSTNENIVPLGNQNLNKIYAKNNYYWNGSKSVTRDGSNKEFKISYFKNVDMNAAIFGGITRNEDGSINLHGFMELTEEGAEAFGTSAGPSDTDHDAVTGGTPDIYVFADDCKKATLSDIDLKAYDSTKALDSAGYNWKPEVEDIILSQFAGTTVEFTVTAKGKEDRKVAISFIQLDGAELQVTAGDTNNNGMLDESETWTIEAVPVISPAVEPETEAKITGFKAEISEKSKDLLAVDGNAAVGAVNKGLNVANGQIKYKAAAGGDAKLSAVVTMTAANGKEVKKNAALNFKVRDRQKIKFDSIETSDPTKVIWTSDNDYIEIDRTAGSFTLKNLRTITADGQDTGTKKLSIKVNDTNVIKLTSAPAGAKGDAEFEIVDKNNDGGTATVTVTSGDDKSVFRNYIVTVKGSNLAWNAANIEIDKAKTAGVQVTLLEPFGKKITGNEVRVEAVYKGTKVVAGKEEDLNNMFEAKHFAGSVYELNTTANAVAAEMGGKALLANGTYTLVFREYTTVDGTPTPGETFSPITVKVVESKPAVTFKQSKNVNLFYKKGTTGSTGKLMLTSKQGRVTLVPTVDANGEVMDIITAGGYFRFTGNNTEYDIIADKENPVTVDPKTGTPDFKAAKQDAKITLRAHVEGYYPAYDVEKKNFGITVEYKQPKLKLTALDKTIYTAIGMKSADILIYDPDADLYLGYNNATIELKGSDAVNKKAYSRANDYFTAGEITKTLKDGKDGVRLTLKDGETKGGAVRLSIKYDEWNDQDSVIVNQSIQVNASNPRLTVKPVKLNINKESFVGKEQAEAQIVLNGAAGFDLVNGLGEGDSITLVPDSRDAAFFNDYVNIETVKNNKGEDTGKIVFESKSGDPVIKLNLKKKDDNFPATPDAKGVYKMDSGYKSSYSFKLQWKIGTAEGETPVKLSLVNKETVTVGVSRSINMANRLGSEVTLKPKMINFNMAQVSNVRLEGDSANLFEISSIDKATGITTVRAKETSVLKKGNYKVMPVFTVDLGVEGTVDIRPLKQVVIRTAQSTLKISGLKDPLEVKLSSPGTSAKRAITIKNEGVYITDLKQTSGLENFELSYDAGGNNVIVTIKDRAGLKENSIYKITALINVEGNGTNVKQQVIAIPVRVIR